MQAEGDAAGVAAEAALLAECEAVASGRLAAAGRELAAERAVADTLRDELAAVRERPSPEATRDRASREAAGAAG